MPTTRRMSEKMSIRSKMKLIPEDYETDVTLVYSQFKSAVEIFQQQAALNFTSSVSGCVRSDRTVAKDLGDRVVLLADVTHIYANQLLHYPNELVEFGRSSASVLPSNLRVAIIRALSRLLCDRKIVSIKETLALLMELQVPSDKKKSKEMTLSHVIQNMNRKHKNEKEKRTLQNILFSMLQEDDEKKATRSLETICDLYRRKVWCDDRTSNAICRACFHSSSSIMSSALSCLLGYEKIDQDNESSDGEEVDEEAIIQPHVVVSKEAVYKAKNTGTTSSKKKKKAKLQRVIRSMKKQQRRSSGCDYNLNYSSPLSSLNDPQGFAEKLFSQLQTCEEKFKIKMMIMKVIARTVGLHRLILLKFYPFLQKYVQPHQSDVTNLLAAAVQACHDMVPPDAVEPLFKQIVNQFVHDRSTTESIVVGLNVVREICLRIPPLMTEDLLQDLVLYKKSHEKSVSSAARSLISLFREICPSLLIKKDRGRPTYPNAKPKVFGEVAIPSDVPGADLLREADVDDDVSNASDEDTNSDDIITHDFDSESNSEVGDDDDDVDDNVQLGSKEDDVSCSDNDNEDEKIIVDEMSIDSQGSDKIRGKKRKFVDIDEELDSASQSLRALTRLAGVPKWENDVNTPDGIFSDEDFKRMKELNAKKEARLALTRHGLLKEGSDQKFKIPSSDQLCLKRVDGYSLEANIRKKMTKEQRKALIKAGREDTMNYQAKTAFKRNKTGGLSNRQKEHNKAMPLIVKRSKIEKSKRARKMKQRGAGKQFRGRKA